MFVQPAAVIIQDSYPVGGSIVNETCVDDHAKDISGISIASPFVVDLLTDDSEFDRLSSWSIVQNVVAANRHGSHLRLEQGAQFRYLDLLADSLFSFHVETLDCVGSIDFRNELQRMQSQQLNQNVGA